MVERRTELDRRYARKAKMQKLKKKLITAAGADRDLILSKIKKLSPWWTEASLEQGKPSAAPKAEPKKKPAPAKKAATK
jgi:hypothetical protein